MQPTEVSPGAHTLTIRLHNSLGKQAGKHTDHVTCEAGVPLDGPSFSFLSALLLSA